MQNAHNGQPITGKIVEKKHGGHVTSKLKTIERWWVSEREAGEREQRRYSGAEVSMRARSRRGQGFYACVHVLWRIHGDVSEARSTTSRDELVCRLTAMPGQQCGGNEMG